MDTPRTGPVSEKALSARDEARWCDGVGVGLKQLDETASGEETITTGKSGIGDVVELALLDTNSFDEEKHMTLSAARPITGDMDNGFADG